MSLNLVADEEVVIIEESRYVKMSVRKDVEEIFAEIINDNNFMKYFYTKFEENVKLINDLFTHVNDMTPAERIMRLSTLPPVPTFLCDAKCIYLKINRKQFNVINKLARTLNTEMSNLTRILFYLSIPQHLYAEFPYLLDHYRFEEEVINFYLQKTDSKKRLQLYNSIMNLILA
jgi:hypothetical protein